MRRGCGSKLVGQRPAGPDPVLRAYGDEPTEAAGVAARCAELIGSGVPAREIAVLFPHERAVAGVRGGAGRGRGAQRRAGGRALLRPAEVRAATVALRAATRTEDGAGGLRASVVAALDAVGWRPEEPPPAAPHRESGRRSPHLWVWPRSSGMPGR
jgi:DNA helicase-2/ATP-dependent DNA helicase PcrA